MRAAAGGRKPDGREVPASAGRRIRDQLAELGLRRLERNYAPRVLAQRDPIRVVETWQRLLLPGG